MTVQETVMVEIDGEEYEVSGDFVVYEPERITEDPYYSTPEDGGYFESIEILHDGENVTGRLPPDLQADITCWAEDKVNNG